MRFPRPILALLWRGVVVLIAGYLAFTAWITPPIEFGANAAAKPAMPSGSLEVANVAPPLTDKDHAAIADYPVFHPSRKPWTPPAPPEAPPVSEAPPPLTGYALVGVIISSGTRSALVRPPGASKTLMLGEGQELGGWTLQEITRDRLRFAAGDATFDMSFLKSSESKP